MNNSRESLEFMNQARLAEALGVDRTTIGAWTKKGLPFIKGDQGKPHIFHLPCSIWWVLGRNFAERRGISGLNAVQQIIFARVIADEMDPGDDMAGEAWMVPMLAAVGVSRDAVIRESAYVMGLFAGIKTAAESRQKRKPARRSCRHEK